VNGAQTIDPKTKGRRLVVRAALLVAYAALMAVAFIFGKGHTVLLDNKDSADGTVKAIESMTISVNGQEPMEFMSGDRDMAKVRAQWHTIKIDINGQVVEKTFSVPLGQDMVLLSIPMLLAGKEPAVVPFVPADEPPPAQEAAEPVTVDPIAAPAAVPPAP
jgi:hypothetical protein